MTEYELVPGTNYGDQTIVGELTLDENLSLKTNTITSGDSPYIIDKDIILNANTLGGSIVVTLPIIADVPNRRYYIKKTDPANILTIQPSGGNTINGGTNLGVTDTITIDIIATSGGNDWTVLTNLMAAPVADLGIMSREALIVNGAGQNLLSSVEYSEVIIDNTASGVLPSGSILGQKKTITIEGQNTPLSTYTVTPSGFVNGSDMVFDTIGQSCVLVWTAGGWSIIGGAGVVVQ